MPTNPTTDTQNEIAPKTVAELQKRALKQAQWFDHLSNNYMVDTVKKDGSHTNPSAEAWRQAAILLREMSAALQRPPAQTVIYGWPLNEDALEAATQSPPQGGDSFSQFRDNEGNPRFDGYSPAPSAEAMHDYLSTACFHGLHERCRQTCKFCTTPCKCECHVAALRSPAIPAPAQGGEARRDALEAAAQIADSFTCGICGMDGKTGAAIRALANVPAPAQGVAVTKEMFNRARSKFFEDWDENEGYHKTSTAGALHAALEAALHPAEKK